MMHRINNAHAHARALPARHAAGPRPAAARSRREARCSSDTSRYNMQPLLTRRELAELLHLSTRSLDRRRAAGEVLDPLPGPGQPRWDPAEVSAWIATGRPHADAWRRSRRRRP
jgi:hypothetical protein